jgi:hypothetical protein
MRPPPPDAHPHHHGRVETRAAPNIDRALAILEVVTFMNPKDVDPLWNDARCAVRRVEVVVAKEGRRRNGRLCAWPSRYHARCLRCESCGSICLQDIPAAVSTRLHLQKQEEEPSLDNELRSCTRVRQKVRGRAVSCVWC